VPVAAALNVVEPHPLYESVPGVTIPNVGRTIEMTSDAASGTLSANWKVIAVGADFAPVAKYRSDFTNAGVTAATAVED
jgi:hypothetical protein